MTDMTSMTYMTHAKANHKALKGLIVRKRRTGEIHEAEGTAVDGARLRFDIEKVPITREASFAIVRFYDDTSEFLQIATAINPVRQEAFYRVEGEGIGYAYKLDFSKADAQFPEALLEGTVGGERLTGTFNAITKKAKTNIPLPKLPVKTVSRMAYFEPVFKEVQEYYTKEQSQSEKAEEATRGFWGTVARAACWGLGAAGGAACCVGTALTGCVVCAGAFGAGASVCSDAWSWA